jgi:hypothetical protein
MAKQSKEQKETVQRVMHEFKHGELNQGGAAAKSKTRSRRSPLLCMRRASNRENPQENRQKLRQTKAKERRGETGQARSEGQRTVRGEPGQARAESHTRAELYQEAKKRDIPGRSKMSKEQLAEALRG